MILKNLNHISKNRYLVGGFFLLLIIIGVSNFKNYGIAWQEPGMRYNAGTSVIYAADLVFPNIVPDRYRVFPSLAENPIRDHGVALDAIYIVIETLLGVEDTQAIYHLYHLLNFFVFLLGVFALYCIIKRRLNSIKLALVGSTFFVLSPRIFADSNYLTADIGFMCILLVATNLSLKFLETKSIYCGIAAGVMTGFAIDIRIQGIVIIPIISTAFLLEYIFTNQKRKEALKLYAIYIFSSVFFIYLFFPYLWSNPVPRFIEVFTSLSRYNWGASVLYAGEFVKANELPWHYSIVWILITTPIIYSVFVIIGVASVCRENLKKERFGFQLTQDLVMLQLLIGPILAVIFLQSVIYDGWRHLYFIYPYFIYFAVIGFSKISFPGKAEFKVRVLRNVVTTAVLLNLTIWMFINNPMQNLYFNTLAGSNLNKNWEMDYLGLGNKRALTYIVENDKSDLITIGVISFTPVDMSVRMLDPQYRERFEFVDPLMDPDYIFNNFRLTSESRYSKYLQNYSLFKNYSSQNSSYIEVWKKLD